jgi:hypothetical protein
MKVDLSALLSGSGNKIQEMKKDEAPKEIPKTSIPDTLTQFLAAVDEADANGGRLPFINEGVHILEIRRCEWKEGRSGLRFQVDFSVEASTTGTKGAGCTYMEMPDVGRDNRGLVKDDKGSLGRIKGFLIAAFGRAIGPQDIALAVGPNQPLTGRLIKCTATSGLSGRNLPIVLKHWEHVPADVAEGS